MVIKKANLYVLFSLVFVLLFVSTGCDDLTDAISDGIVDAVIEDIEVEDNEYSVPYNTTKDEIVYDYLPESTNVTFDDGSEDDYDITWKASEDFLADQAGNYDFTGTFIFDNTNVDFEVKVIILEKN